MGSCSEALAPSKRQRRAIIDGAGGTTVRAATWGGPYADAFAFPGSGLLYYGDKGIA